MSDSFERLREVASGLGTYINQAELADDIGLVLDYLERYEQGYKGSCYACEPVGEKNVELNKRIAELELRLRAEAQEIVKLVDRLQQSEDENGQLTARIAELEADNERLTDEFGDLRDENERLTKSLKHEAEMARVWKANAEALADVANAEADRIATRDQNRAEAQAERNGIGEG